MIVLDFGSGETCQNDFGIVKRMIDELARVDSRKENVIIKWQLFHDVPAGCKPLGLGVFTRAYDYALDRHYFTTASVFDENSLKFLLNFNPVFVKIAARPKLYRLLDLVPKDVTTFVSIPPGFDEKKALMAQYPNMKPLYCVPEYPASPTVYETAFGGNLSYSISDHTHDWYLRNKYRPLFHEVHYKLDDSTGLDSGPWARTARQLEEVL